MAKETSSRGHKGEVQEITFRPAKGGVISETRMKYKRGGQGGGPIHDYETETAVHGSHLEAAKHLKTILGHCFAHADEELAEAKGEKKE